MPAERRGSFRPDIEGLRAVAIVTVVLYHLNLLHVSGGFIGVDVFFVISGFLITGQLVKVIDADGPHALPAFYARRIKRLLPAASLTLVATVIGWRIWGLITLPDATPKDAIFATFYGLNYRLAYVGSQYFNPVTSPPPLQHFWSLAVEEQFYLVWPALILITFWRRGARRLRNLAIVLTVVAAASLWLSWKFTLSAPTWSYYGLQTRAWELAVGALVAVFTRYAEQIKPILAALLTWAGLAAIVIAAFVFTSSTTYPGLSALLPVLGAAAVITGGSAAPRLGAGLALDRQPAQVVGRLSYSWYLWHFPIIIIAPLAIGHPLGHWARAGLFVITFAVAAASYLLVEQPLRRRQWRPLGWFVLAATSAVVVISVALLAIAFPRPSAGPGPTIAAPRLSGSVAQQDAEIVQAVKASLRVKEVPRNLKPDLAQAFGDGLAVPGDCFLGFSRVSVGTCAYGDLTATRTVVLFGDSSVAQWLPAIDQIGKQNHWRVIIWSKSSCTINDAIIPSLLTLLPYRSCLQWRDQTIQRINALHPQVVIVGEFLFKDDAAYPVGNTHGHSYRSYSADAWARLTASTVQALKAPGRTVAYLLPDAYPDGSKSRCLAAYLKDLQRCTTPIATAKAPADRWAAETKVLTAAGDLIIDPTTLMCADGECPPIVGNIPVYRDGYHVTATYARFLAPMFETLLKP